jgi:single-stranded DNA-specific DHH superfamily exonuclease
MSLSVEDQKIQELETQIESLKDEVKNLEEKIVQEKISFELKKNDLKDEVAASLRGYSPKGLGVNLPEVNLEVLSFDDFDKVLLASYKLED